MTANEMLIEIQKYLNSIPFIKSCRIELETNNAYFQLMEINNTDLTVNTVDYCDVCEHPPSPEELALFVQANIKQIEIIALKNKIIAISNQFSLNTDVSTPFNFNYKKNLDYGGIETRVIALLDTIPNLQRCIIEIETNLSYISLLEINGTSFSTGSHLFNGIKMISTEGNLDQSLMFESNIKDSDIDLIHSSLNQIADEYFLAYKNEPYIDNVINYTATYAKLG